MGNSFPLLIVGQSRVYILVRSFWGSCIKGLALGFYALGDPLDHVRWLILARLNSNISLRNFPCFAYILLGLIIDWDGMTDLGLVINENFILPCKGFLAHKAFKNA